MKTGVFYFTGTGNTEFIAREFRDAFGPEHPTDLHNVEALPALLPDELLAPYDRLIFGAPVLGFNPPRFFARFLRRLPPGRSRRTVLFLNAGGERWADIGYASAILKRRGFDVVSEYFFLTPSNMLVRSIDPKTGDMSFTWPAGGFRQNVTALLATCREDVRRAAVEILAGTTRLAQFSLPARAVFAATRWLFHGLACSMFRFHVRAGPDCNGCARCARSCPTRNIRMKKGRPSFGSDCTVCYRCINICPKLAIRLRWPLGAMGNRVSYLSPGWAPPEREA